MQKLMHKEENKKSMGCKTLLVKWAITMKIILVFRIFIRSPCIY